MKVLITGASSGIGKELTRIYAGSGNECFLTALEDRELASFADELRGEHPGVNIRYMTLDLSIPGSAQELYDRCEAERWMPEVLINNAGFATYGYMPEIPVDREMQMIQLHVMELYRLTRLFLDHMLRSDRGYIINISSISAFQPSPMLTTYGATKAFVYQWTRGLQHELRLKGSKVRAMVVCPTPVRTGFGQGTDLVHTVLFRSWMTVDAPMVAKAIYKAMLQKKEFIVPGKLYHYLSKISRRLPEKFQIWLSYQHLKQRKS